MFILSFIGICILIPIGTSILIVNVDVHNVFSIDFNTDSNIDFSRDLDSNFHIDFGNGFNNGFDDNFDIGSDIKMFIWIQYGSY